MIVLFCTAIVSFGAEYDSLPKLMNIAHRGFSFAAPENTLAAYRLAVEAGASGAECDVYRTTDGVLVLAHDKTFKRTAGVDTDVTKMSFEEVRNLDVGKWKGERFANEKVPTLEEYLSCLRGTACIPVIEIKQEGIEEDVAKLLDKLGMVDAVFVISFSTKTLAELRKIEPRLKTAHLFSLKVEGDAEDQAEAFLKTLIEKAKAVGTNSVSLNDKMLSPKLIDLLHYDGLNVLAWRVN